MSSLTHRDGGVVACRTGALLLVAMDDCIMCSRFITADAGFMPLPS